MSEQEKTRSDEVEEFKKDIEEIIKEADQVKQMAQQNIETNRAICIDVDKIGDSLGKQKIIARAMTKEVVDALSKDEWQDMRMQFGQTGDTYRNMYSLRRDMEAAGYQGEGFKTVVNTFVYSTATTGVSGYDILVAYGDKYASVKAALETVKFLPTWIDDIAFIKEELQKIMPDALRRFESVVADMSGIGALDLKHKALLSLRSVIFNQLFDTIAPEALYSKTAWFNRAPPGTLFKKMRFCQAKFFVFGDHDESGFPQSMIDAVNKAAKELFDYFNEMSEYGKGGASGVLVDNCYKQTLTSFANAIKLRNQFQKNP